MKAEQKDSADPQAAQEIRAFTMKFDETYNKHDAATLAAFFTEDAVQVSPGGLIFGRQAIEKRYADNFQQWHPANYVGGVDQVNRIGQNLWEVGEWSCVVQTKDGPFQ